MDVTVDQLLWTGMMDEQQLLGTDGDVWKEWQCSDAVLYQWNFEMMHRIYMLADTPFIDKDMVVTFEHFFDTEVYKKSDNAETLAISLSNNVVNYVVQINVKDNNFDLSRTVIRNDIGFTDIVLLRVDWDTIIDCLSGKEIVNNGLPC